ncbi:hypothetical protein SGO_0563 [Streptococcus gordonii str. Challis substr. CH1]|uniref:Uncharacterized protein n=1 Tax=Streptococcus gordonii (strain Challis / ATCC 35105 / BCRC 15272 / CH1 / DL1 / V288) TaxID=467705 RepID=A8AVR9_STRGC|nr:hypothetical protein SGO_0563 [Streptococcus gordonii str. Challis substr. CH1]
MSYPGKIYQEIRQYLKNGRVELIELENMISHTCQIPEHGARLPWDVYLLFIQIPTYNILLY